MGLDMYLYGVKQEFEKHDYNIGGYKESTEIGYWRKANAIHNWFVNNCGDGEDTCQQMYVSLEKLEELLDACKQVSKDHGLAPVLLPTQDGFFFGSTEYDDWYFDKIEDTIKIIEPVIEFLKNIKDKCKSNDWWDVVYQASW